MKWRKQKEKLKGGKRKKWKSFTSVYEMSTNENLISISREQCQEL